MSSTTAASSALNPLAGQDELVRLRAQVAELTQNVTALAQDKKLLLKLYAPGGTMPPVTTAIPTVMVQGIKVKATIYEYAILAGAIALMLLLWALPLMKPIKRRIESKIYRIFPIITLLNFFILGVTLHALHFMAINDLFFAVVKGVEVLINGTQKVLVAFAAFLVLVLFWKFKDRILETIGVDNPSMVIGEFRDWATCWSMKRFYPIELFIWKVEGLPGLHLHQANDVYVEVTSGYNNVMRTRVHLRAGHSCIFKESIQLNFDHFDTDVRFYITIKNQDVMGATDIASIQMGASQVKRFLELEPRELNQTSRAVGWGAASSKAANSVWQEDRFQPIDLIPAGQIYVRFRTVEDEEKATGPSYGRDRTAC